MLGFGRKDDDKEKKESQEQISQAMRSMSDQIARQAQEIKKLEDALDDAKDKAAGGDTTAKALAEAQAQLRQLKAEMAKMRADAAREASEAAAGGKSGAASAAGSVGVTKVGPAAPAAEPAPAAPAPTPGGLSVGITAYVRETGGKNLRLRNGPGLDTNAFAGLPPGTSMTLLEGPVEDDGYPWWRIRTVDGREGWVAGTELVTQPE